MECLRKIHMLILLVFTAFTVCSSTSLTKVTDKLFSGVEDGIIAAFGDFNVDRLTDIFVITKGGQQVELLISKKTENGYIKGPKPLIPQKKGDIESVITSVVPGDFDGDVQMDVLLTRKLIGSDSVHVEIYWGNTTDISVHSDPYVFTETFKDEPTLLDWNADMLPDLLFETSPGNRSIWLAKTNRTFERIPFSRNGPTADMTVPHSNAFVDLNGDSTADLLITSTVGLEIWLNTGGNFVYNKNISMPSDCARSNIGQVTAVDIDQDTFVDLLLPVNCSGGEIYVYTHKHPQWQKMAKDFSYDGKSWEFARSTNLNVSIPITLRVGDFDMDGYPDVLTVLQHTDTDGKTEYKALLLLNVECGEDEKSCEMNDRKFEAQWKSGLNVGAQVAAAAFFDLYENGILDILLVTVSSSKPPMPSINAFRNDLSSDAYFVKVTVGSGRECPPGRKPYSVNHAGATIKYAATRTDRSKQESSATQLSQSAHCALQMPYTVFGLGQTPNFVDTLSVGIPTSTRTKRVKEWTQIIPNSQMMVVPYPYKDPSKWVLKLSLTPSHMVMVTAAVLVGTCGCVAIIVAVLQWREKREDKEEKRLDAHKFHFDAM